MVLLIDTNVILDMVFKPKDYVVSMELFRKIKESGTNALITASAVTDLFYIIRKETHDTERTYQIMENILKLVDILSVTDTDIRDAFSQKWKDFEDCVQYTIAKNNGIDYFVTVNLKDFESDSLPVILPYKCLKVLEDRN